jgi:hypothetical protein
MFTKSLHHSRSKSLLSKKGKIFILAVNHSCQKRGRFSNHENQKYNFAGKKEECVTWHLRKFLRCIKVPLEPLKYQVTHPSFFPAKLYF